MVLAETKRMLEDRIFLEKAFRIALPVAMQGMLNTIVNLVDTMMIGTLGETTIAAVGLANKVFFVFSLLVFGIVSGSGVLAAQYWGNQDVKNIRKVLGLALTLALGGAFLFLIPAVVCPETVMRIFTVSAETIRIGGIYLVIAAISYPFTAITNVYVAMLRAVGQVKLPVITSCMAIVINIVLNFLLIFPERDVMLAIGAGAGTMIHIPGVGMGVAGAAAATLTARVAEASVLVLAVYIKKFPIACRVRELFGYSGAFIRQFIGTCTPVIANEFMWGLGVTLYSLAYGRMGDNAVAAITIATTIQDIVFVLFQGLSAATAVILGNEMGAGNLKRAEKYASYFFRLVFLLSAVGMVIILVIRGPLLSVYSISPEVERDAARCLLAFVLFLPAKMFNLICIVGVLRSGGDTKVCLFLDTSGVWLIGVPLAFLGGLFFKFPIYIVYGMVMLEELYKGILGYLRYRQKKWLRNLAVEIQGK